MSARRSRSRKVATPREPLPAEFAEPLPKLTAELRDESSTIEAVMHLLSGFSHRTRSRMLSYIGDKFGEEVAMNLDYAVNDRPPY